MTERPSPKSTLLDRGLRPKKSFGQNFMVDQRINLIFAEAVASLGRNVPVIEIGAGTGSLTQHLLKVSSVVHAVERDRDLVPILREQFNAELDEGKLVLHEADGARFDIASVFKTPGVLVGNLPYHLTSSILLLALKHRLVLHGAVFLVQKEVADRLVSGPNTKNYGFLTVVLKLAFELEKVAHVDKSAFWPVPKIDSTIIRLKTVDHGISKIEDQVAFISFVREIFQKRRKKLSTILNKKIDKSALQSLEIDPDLRPENLLPAQFLQMFLWSQANPVGESF